MYYAEQSGSESCLWLSITHHHSQSLAQHYTPWFINIGSAYLTVIHNHWLSIAHHDSQPLSQYNTHDSQPLAQHNNPWFTTTCAALHTMMHSHWLSIEQHNYASGFELWSIILSHWLCIILCYSEAVVVNHGELCWASGCESWCVILSQWSLIMVFYAE
jgi:hypothetical protein